MIQDQTLTGRMGADLQYHFDIKKGLKEVILIIAGRPGEFV